MLSQNKPDRIRILFDDHRLVANAGLLLPATLARHLGLRELVDHHLDLGGAPGRANGPTTTCEPEGPGGGGLNYSCWPGPGPLGITSSAGRPTALATLSREKCCGARDFYSQPGKGGLTPNRERHSSRFISIVQPVGAEETLEKREVEADHRRHAEVENAIRDLKYGVGLNHMPSGRFAANGAWLAVQVMAHNLARWSGLVWASGS